LNLFYLLVEWIESHFYTCSVLSILPRTELSKAVCFPGTLRKSQDRWRRVVFPSAQCATCVVQCLLHRLALGRGRSMVQIRMGHDQRWDSLCVIMYIHLLRICKYLYEWSSLKSNFIKMLIIHILKMNHWTSNNWVCNY
jgi:hypothetical protein